MSKPARKYPSTSCCAVPETALDLAQALMRCPSVTPTDAGALDVLETKLKSLGFVCHRLPFGEGDARVDNLYARYGTQGRNFCFAGHTDVVPPGALDQWERNPFDPIVDQGWLLGRGASDMKTAIAAFVEAAETKISSGLDTGCISLLITGDEEGPAINGTTKVLDWLEDQDEIIDHCLVGEPTCPRTFGEMVKNGRRGSLNATITVMGAQGHVAYPHLAESPFPRLLAFLNAVTADALDQGYEDFDPSNLEITTIDTGNKTENVIPAVAKARLNIRFNPNHSGASLTAWLKGLAEEHAGAHELAIRVSGEPFLTQRGPFTDLIVDAITAETGTAPVLSTTGGTSDARFITRACPVVQFGLVGQTMHKVDERVRVDDVHALSRVYTRILDAYFSAESL
ncbi:MAG: succinyl-diaminopimelate desuccinylase [Pseudomonadota bacterium]